MQRTLLLLLLATFLAAAGEDAPKPVRQINSLDSPTPPGWGEDEQVKILPFSVESRREYSFGKGNGNTHSLQLSVQIARRRGARLLANCGYQLEETRTDSGERIVYPHETFSFTQETFWPEHSMSDWENNERLTTELFFSNYSVQMELGQANEPANGLKISKGHFLMKMGMHSKKIDIEKPHMQVGKAFEAPELARVKLKLISIKGNEIVFECASRREDHVAIEQVQFFDGRGAPIHRVSQVTYNNLGLLMQCTLQLLQPLPPDGKMVFVVYDQIQEVKAPFAVHDIVFDPPVEPEPKKEKAPELPPETVLAPDDIYTPDFRSLESRRSISLRKEQRFSHSLTLSASMKYAADRNVICSEGSVLNSIISDTGEKLIASPRYLDSTRSLVRFWESKKDRIDSLHYYMNLGNPRQKLKGIKSASGTMLVQRAMAIQRVEVTPEKWIGRMIDTPELKDMHIYLESLNDKSIVLHHPSDSRYFLRLKAIEIVDDKGAAIEWTCKTREDGERHRRYYRFNLGMERPMPPGGKIIFVLYDQIRTERVPFDIKDIPIEAPYVVDPKTILDF